MNYSNNLIFLFFIVITSCIYDKNPNDSEEEYKVKQERKKSIIINQLKLHYGIEDDIIGTFYKYSYEIEDISKNQFHIIDDFSVEDLYFDKKDSSYHCVIEAGFYPNYIMNLKLSTDHFNNLTSIFEDYYKISNYGVVVNQDDKPDIVFLINIDMVRKIFLSVNTYSSHEEEYEDNNIRTYLDLKNDDYFWVKGSIQKIISIK